MFDAALPPMQPDRESKVDGAVNADDVHVAVAVDDPIPLEAGWKAYENADIKDANALTYSVPFRWSCVASPSFNHYQ